MCTNSILDLVNLLPVRLTSKEEEVPCKSSFIGRHFSVGYDTVETSVSGTPSRPRISVRLREVSVQVEKKKCNRGHIIHHNKSFTAP